MSAVATLAADAGARLAPKAGSLIVRIHKTFVDNTFLGTFILPHKYQLEVIQCGDKTYHQTSIVVETPADVEFWWSVLRSQAEKNNFSFVSCDETKEFPRLVT